MSQSVRHRVAQDFSPAAGAAHRRFKDLRYTVSEDARSTRRELANQLIGIAASLYAGHAGGGAIEQQRPLARVARERGRALELRARLVEAAELREKVAAHARQQVVRLAATAPTSARRPAPARPAGRTPSQTATARFSSTTGDGASARASA